MFTVSRNGETKGPWSIEEIARKLGSMELSVTDFVWDDAKKDWVSLLDFAPLKSHLMSQKPARPPETRPSESRPPETSQVTQTYTKIESADVAVVNVVGTEERPDWYVSRGQQKFGPFTYLGVIKALQNKSVYEFDYIWTSGMDSWVRIAQHPRFGGQAIRELMNSPEAAPIFAARKHPRIRVESEVFVHDNNSLSSGRMVEASEGGTGLVVKNSTLIPGQMVNVHYASIEGLPAFNAVGEVVSKKFAKGARDRRSPIHYGVRFVKIDGQASTRVREFIQSWLSKSVA